MNSTKVSILIPVYNRSKYIAECIQSAWDQTFTDIEIVIVDNASDDGTWEICVKYAALDNRVRIFRNKTNIGPVRNWIRCAQEARGEYSKILFSDDLLEPDCVAQMLQPFDNLEVGLVFCAARIGESKEKSVIAYSVKSDSLIAQKKYLSLLLHNQAPVSPGAAMLRTIDLIRNLHTNFPTATPRPFDRHGAGPDVMIMLLTVISYSKVMCISTPLVFFRAHAGSFSISNTNNEVSMGYTSAIAYYLRKNESWYCWVNYLMRSWLSNVSNQRRWINPITFLRSNEGHGSFFEVFVGMAIMPFLVAGKFMRLIQARRLAKRINRV
jgi:glycosyltransferase involved in cell wall biosynthesis